MQIMWEVVFAWLVIVPTVLASLVWLYRDTKRHGQPGLLWAGLSLFAYPFGLIAWLILRPFAKSKVNV